MRRSGNTQRTKQGYGKSVPRRSCRAPQRLMMQAPYRHLPRSAMPRPPERRGVIVSARRLSRFPQGTAYALKVVIRPMAVHAGALAVLAVALLFAVPAGSREDTWSLPLVEKERIIEANIVKRHNILGRYPSQVEVPLDGDPVDQTTLGNSNIAHSVCWTANYLAGASYRYAFLRRQGGSTEEAAVAKARADELFEAVYRCQLVTGVRGLQARGYVFGHGESYEERWGSEHSDDWHQGAGEYEHLRWRGSPSHHNYSDAIHGLGAYYDLAAEGEQKERLRENIITTKKTENTGAYAAVTNFLNLKPSTNPVPDGRVSIHRLPKKVSKKFQITAIL